jgi:hypothetical protein
MQGRFGQFAWMLALAGVLLAMGCVQVSTDSPQSGVQGYPDKRLADALRAVEEGIDPAGGDLPVVTGQPAADTVPVLTPQVTERQMTEAELNAYIQQKSIAIRKEMDQKVIDDAIQRSPVEFGYAANLENAQRHHLEYTQFQETLTPDETKVVVANMIAAMDHQQDIRIKVHGKTCFFPYDMYSGHASFWSIPDYHGKTTTKLMFDYGILWDPHTAQHMGRFAEDADMRRILAAFHLGLREKTGAMFLDHGQQLLIRSEMLTNNPIEFHCKITPAGSDPRTLVRMQMTLVFFDELGPEH